MDALLYRVYHSDSAFDEDRIVRLMRELDELPESQISLQLNTGDISGSFQSAHALSMGGSRKNRSLQFAVLAISILFLLFGWYSLAPPKSKPTAQQILTQILNTPAADRTYDLVLISQLPAAEQRTIRAKLYLNDRDQFAVELPGLLDLGTWWIGGTPKDRWVVPPIGPAMDGGEGVIGGWLTKKDVPSPYLHLNTIATRLSLAYDLRRLPDEILPEEAARPSRICRRLLGTRREGDSSLATKIELWAETSSGVVQQVIIQWDRTETNRGPIKLTISLIAEESLSSAIFRPETHLRQNQPVFRINTEDELSQLSSDF